MNKHLSAGKQGASSQESAAGNRQIRQNGSFPLVVTKSEADRVILGPPGIGPGSTGNRSLRPEQKAEVRAENLHFPQIYFFTLTRSALGDICWKESRRDKKGDQRRRLGGGGKHHPNDDPGDERNPGGAKRRERDVTCPGDKTGRLWMASKNEGQVIVCECGSKNSSSDLVLRSRPAGTKRVSGKLIYSRTELMRRLGANSSGPLLINHVSNVTMTTDGHDD
uniref:Uncharacterized protein n=1 Tax=Branchiostoma floridae TaxID=7739 RepID=C3YC04_BRAFL|eukprot:XP_002606169.1 hypothetical protein BRAFLDRAFT_92036 [Branchiostoma floridae]